VIINTASRLKRAVWQVRALHVNRKGEELTSVVEEKEAFHHCHHTDLLSKGFCFQFTVSDEVGA